MEDKELLLYLVEVEFYELERMLYSCCDTVMGKTSAVDKLREIRSLVSELV